MPYHSAIHRIIAACSQISPGRMDVRYDESMAAHTTFKTGGPADCWIQLSGAVFPASAAALLRAARAEGVPVFIAGGGANIVVADSGIRGIVLDMGGWTGTAGNDAPINAIRFCSGTAIDDAAEIAAARGLSGLEFAAGMPGSIGGAVWMNARCYEREIADVLVETDTIDFSGLSPAQTRLTARAADFGYKRSPFQGRDTLILSALFQLTPRNAESIRAEMETHRRDRKAKGHYRYPSAGSVFKNNRDFGKPAGKIIDEAGLRGLQIGGAQIAPWHGNIIINTGGASAADIRLLVNEAAARVKAITGFTLEPEILFVGG